MITGDTANAVDFLKNMPCIGWVIIAFVLLGVIFAVSDFLDRVRTGRLVISMRQSSVKKGVAISGTVVVHARRTFESEGLIVQLTGERYGAVPGGWEGTQGRQMKVHWETIELDGSTTYQSGRQSFQFTIPAPPSSELSWGVKWYVRARLKRPSGSSDLYAKKKIAGWFW